MQIISGESSGRFHTGPEPLLDERQSKWLTEREKNEEREKEGGVGKSRKPAGG